MKELLFVPVLLFAALFPPWAVHEFDANKIQSLVIAFVPLFIFLMYSLNNIKKWEKEREKSFGNDGGW